MSQPKVWRFGVVFFPAQMIVSVIISFSREKSGISFSSSFKSETSHSSFILFADPVCRRNQRLYNQARENYGTKGWFHHYNGRFGKSSRPINVCPYDCDNKLKKITKTNTVHVEYIKKKTFQMLKRHKNTVTVSLRSPIFNKSQAVWDEF